MNRKLVVHADNARPHTTGRTPQYIEGCGIVRAPHPPYLPDLALPDCFLFDYLESMLQRRHFKAENSLFGPIMDLSGANEKVTLERVFLEWMDKLAKCLSANGDDVGADEIIHLRGMELKRHCVITTTGL
jgi:hypothetical protein